MDSIDSPLSPFSSYHRSLVGNGSATDHEGALNSPLSMRSAIGEGGGTFNGRFVVEEGFQRPKPAGRQIAPVRRPPPAVPTSVPPFGAEAGHVHLQTPPPPLPVAAPAHHPSPSSSSSQQQQQQQTSQQPQSQQSLRAEDHHAKGFQYRKQGDFHSAIAEYTKAIEVDPTYFKALFNRGFALEKVGRSEEAIADYSKAIELNPSNAFAYYNRGISFDRIGSFEKACADFTQAIAFQSSNVDFYHNRAFCLRKLDRWEEAIHDYSAAMELAPSNGHFKSVFNRAICYDKIGQLERALKDFNTAHSLQPRHVGCLSNRGLLYEKSGQVEAALEDCDRALFLLSQGNAVAGGGNLSLLVTVTRARLRGKVNDVDGAVEDLRAAAQLEPRDLNVLFSRAVYLKACERLEEAVEDFTLVISFLSRSDDANRSVGMGTATYSEENISSGKALFNA